MSPYSYGNLEDTGLFDQNLCGHLALDLGFNFAEDVRLCAASADGSF